MGMALSAAIDRQLEHLILARARRRSPALRLMPTRWLRPAIAPTAARLRRSLLRRVLTVAWATGVVLTMLMLTP